jgi:hypothetical protein
LKNQVTELRSEVPEG